MCFIIQKLTLIQKFFKNFNYMVVPNPFSQNEIYLKKKIFLETTRWVWNKTSHADKYLAVGDI